MVWLGIESGAAGWKVKTFPLSYGDTPQKVMCFLPSFKSFIGF